MTLVESDSLHNVGAIEPRENAVQGDTETSTCDMGETFDLPTVRQAPEKLAWIGRLVNFLRKVVH